jgi:diaminopimelate epimerase
MRGLVFYKMTGSGNDFVLLDGRHTAVSEWPAERISTVCDRRMGIGADGLVILTPDATGRIQFDFYNSDGSRGAMCGNAALCSTRLAATLEMASPEGMILCTDAGLVRTRCTGPGHMAEINLPPFDLPAPVEIEARAGESAFLLATVGVPHLVVLTDDVKAVDVFARGRELRFHPALGAPGANVNFVSPPANGNGDEPWMIRTYERGVEGETLACGTGTVAAAFTLAVLGRRRLPAEWQTSKGIRLGVSGSVQGGSAQDAWLLGEGRLVYTGILR